MTTYTTKDIAKTVKTEHRYVMATVETMLKKMPELKAEVKKTTFNNAVSGAAFPCYELSERVYYAALYGFNTTEALKLRLQLADLM